MCLTVYDLDYYLNDDKTLKYKVAEEDLTFYKVVRLPKEKEGVHSQFVSPFLSSEINTYQMYEMDDYTVYEIGHVLNISAGMIHLISTLEDAYKLKDKMETRDKFYNYEYHVLKAIIPKGTKYIEGVFDWYIMDCHVNAIATKKIWYIDTLPFQNWVEQQMVNYGKYN